MCCARTELDKKTSMLKKEHEQRNKERSKNVQFCHCRKMIDCWKQEDESWQMPTNVKAFVKEADRQRKIEKDRSRKHDEKIKKIEEAAAAKLREDIKQAREKQVPEILERKRKAKDNDE